MCNLYKARSTRAEIASLFGAEDHIGYDMEKDYVSPGREGMVITAAENRRALAAMKWGFPPPPGARAPVVNVRNYPSPFWRSALKNPERRCLVPVSEFQEWSVEPDAITGKKRAHWFSVPARPIFSFAGVWRPTEKGPVYAFLTCGFEGDPAHHIVGRIHPKACPVILHTEDEDRWLHADVEEALGLACAHPSQLMAVA